MGQHQHRGELPDGYRPTAQQLEMVADELETWWYEIA
jgi:hypothetical protein